MVKVLLVYQLLEPHGNIGGHILASKLESEYLVQVLSRRFFSAISISLDFFFYAALQHNANPDLILRINNLDQIV